MRKLSLGGGPPPGSPPQAHIDWLTKSVRTIEQASQENDITDLGQNFTTDAAPTLTTALAVSSPTLANTNAVLATVLAFFKKGGPNRTA
ncbi:MAG: hypothetical protein ACLPKB_24695 [Xanthobacteraceae bacterium]